MEGSQKMGNTPEMFFTDDEGAVWGSLFEEFLDEVYRTTQNTRQTRFY